MLCDASPGGSDQGADPETASCHGILMGTVVLSAVSDSGPLDVGTVPYSTVLRRWC